MYFQLKKEYWVSGNQTEGNQTEVNMDPTPTVEATGQFKYVPAVK